MEMELLLRAAQLLEEGLVLWFPSDGGEPYAALTDAFSEVLPAASVFTELREQPLEKRLLANPRQ